MDMRGTTEPLAPTRRCTLAWLGAGEGPTDALHSQCHQSDFVVIPSRVGHMHKYLHGLCGLLKDSRLHSGLGGGPRSQGACCLVTSSNAPSWHLVLVSVPFPPEPSFWRGLMVTPWRRSWPGFAQGLSQHSQGQASGGPRSSKCRSNIS